MGVYPKCYAGAYLLVNLKELNEYIIIPTCNNQDCENHNDKVASNYCPECGQKIVAEEIVMKEMLNMHDKLREIYGNGHELTVLNSNRIEGLNENQVIIIENETGDYGEFIDMHSMFNASERDQDMPKTLFENEYNLLFKFLNENDIHYNLNYGFITYYR